MRILKNKFTIFGLGDNPQACLQQVHAGWKAVPEGPPPLRTRLRPSYVSVYVYSMINKESIMYYH